VQLVSLKGGHQDRARRAASFTGEVGEFAAKFMDEYEDVLRKLAERRSE
jgi:hypothetical protein